MTTTKELNESFTVGSREYQSKLDEDLFINRSDLSNEYATHAERFGWYATCLELAQDKLTRLEADLDHAYALLDVEKRSELMRSNLKSTEKMVENSVFLDVRYIELQNKVFDARKSVGLLKAARDSMMARKDMLISLGATYRAEVKADMNLIANEVKYK